MTKWPLICDSCGTEVYVGTLAGGECSECHLETVCKQVLVTEEKQSGLGDFA